MEYGETSRMLPIGYDLSHHNAVDFPALAKNAAFLVHKATQGSTFIDPQYQSRQAQALEAGILWGAYHFGTNDPISQQVDLFLSVIDRSHPVLLALDLESNTTTGGNMGLKEASQFVQAIFQATGKWPVLYSRASYVDPLNDQSFSAKMQLWTLAHCPLWIANASVPPILPDGWTQWAIQQFDITKPSGSNAGIDTNQFNGSSVELLSWWTAHAVVLSQRGNMLQDLLLQLKAKLIEFNALTDQAISLSANQDGPLTGQLVTVSGDGLRVRMQPSITSPIKGLLAKGAIVAVVEASASRDWYKIIDGQYSGYYIAKEFTH